MLPEAKNGYALSIFSSEGFGRAKATLACLLEQSLREVLAQALYPSRIEDFLHGRQVNVELGRR
jgi:hypothetical protein